MKRPSAMTRETRVLLARQYLHFAGGTPNPSDFVNWAVSLLETGVDTEHLRMLASLGHAPDKADVDYYFGQSMSDLGWEIPEPEQLTRQYARDLAQEIIDGTIPPITGCHQMYRLYCYFDAPLNMQAWLYLDDQLEQGTYQELEGPDWELAIRREALNFLQMSSPG